MGVASLSAVLKKRMERQRQLNIDRTQIGFVNVENFHHIDVGFATGEVQDFEEYVTVPDTLDISVTQVGLVNVSTTDRVEVNVALAALSSGSHFDKAVLKSVLKEAGL